MYSIFPDMFPIDDILYYKSFSDDACSSNNMWPTHAAKQHIWTEKYATYEADRGKSIEEYGFGE